MRTHLPVGGAGVSRKPTQRELSRVRCGAFGDKTTKMLPFATFSCVLFLSSGILSDVLVSQLVILSKKPLKTNTKFKQSA